ncbi:hypothetical protein HHI36_006337, partial [Cryptolaemus montrouzieri]
MIRDNKNCPKLVKGKHEIGQLYFTLENDEDSEDSDDSLRDPDYHDDNDDADGGTKTLGMILSDSDDESASDVDDRLELENENSESRNPSHESRKSSRRKEKYENDLLSDQLTEKFYSRKTPGAKLLVAKNKLKKPSGRFVDVDISCGKMNV